MAETIRQEPMCKNSKDQVHHLDNKRRKLSEYQQSGDIISGGGEDVMEVEDTSFSKQKRKERCQDETAKTDVIIEGRVGLSDSYRNVLLKDLDRKERNVSISTKTENCWTSKKVEIPDQMKKRCVERWRTALLGKFVGRALSYEYIEKSLSELWKLEQKPNFVQMGEGVFAVNFWSEEDKQKVFQGGPWVVSGRTLILKNWCEGFGRDKQYLTTMNVWIRLPSLPLGCF